jgi:hypothetical protein
MHGSPAPQRGIDQRTKPGTALRECYVENNPAITIDTPRRSATMMRDDHAALNYRHVPHAGQTINLL